MSPPFGHPRAVSSIFFLSTLFTPAALLAAPAGDGLQANAPASVAAHLAAPTQSALQRSALTRRQSALRARAALKQRFVIESRKRPGATGPKAFDSATARIETVTSVGRLELDTEQGTVMVRTELTVRALGQPLSSFYLYLGEFEDDHVVGAVDSEGALSLGSVTYGVAPISLRRELAVGESVTFTVEQSGTPVCSTDFLDLVVCSVGTARSFEVGTSWQVIPYDVENGDLAYPESGLLSIVAPGESTAIASGLVESVRENPDGTRTFTFRNDYKGTFSFALASGMEDGVTPFGADQEVHSYFYSSGTKPYGQAWRQRAAEIMNFHGARYGAYTPSVINIAEIPDGTGAAYGPMLTIFVPTAGLIYPPTEWWATTTLAHELAHQWFAGHIETADAYSPWLAEGFATFAEMEYSAPLASEEYGVDYAPTMRQGSNIAYIYTVPPEKDVPLRSADLYEADSMTYVMVTYTKGSLVVNALRYLLGGDEPFYAAMRRYRGDHEGKSATVSSMLASLEAASGVDLENFEKHWIDAAGYPTYAVSLKRGRDERSGKFSATIEITADRDFGMPLEVEVSTADGKSERLRIPYQGQPSYQLTIERASEILGLRFDPDKQLIGISRGALPGDISINGAVDGVDVIYAAMALGKRFDPNEYTMSSFTAWADLVFDGQIDDQDLDIVLDAFGSSSAQGGAR